MTSREDLCRDVAHTRKLKDRSYGRPGNESSSRGRSYLDARGAVLCFDVVRQASALCQVEGQHGAFRAARRFFYCKRRIRRLPKPDAHASFLVAEDKRGREIEATASGHNTRDTPDTDELLCEFASPLVSISSATPTRRTTAGTPSATTLCSLE